MVYFKLKLIVIIYQKPFPRHHLGLLRKFQSLPLKTFHYFIFSYFLFIRISKCTHKYNVLPYNRVIQTFNICCILWKVYIEKYKA